MFSLKRFLDNKKFQYKLREESDKLFPGAWVSLYKQLGNDEGIYCLRFQKRQN